MGNSASLVRLERCGHELHGADWDDAIGALVDHTGRGPQLMSARKTQKQQRLSSMKLYLAPGACSLADHIAMHEAGLEFDRTAVRHHEGLA